MEQLIKRVRTMIDYGCTAIDVRDRLISEYTDELIFFAWVAARMI